MILRKMSKKRNDLLHKLYWREVRGCIQPHAHARQQKLFTKIPGRLGFSLKHLVPTSILEEGYVFLGFTKNGQFVLSYCVQLAFDIPIYFQYKLQTWLFIPHRPLKRINEVVLFRDEKITSELHLAVCEWPQEDGKILIYGASDSTIGGESHCFVTIASVPPLSPCQDCAAAKPTDEGEVEREQRQGCLRHSLTVHTKYESTPPHPPFIPQIHLQIDGVVILNTGDSIIAVEVKTAREIAKQTSHSDTPSTNYHSMMCREQILPDTTRAMCQDDVANPPACLCEDPLGLAVNDRVDGLLCDCHHDTPASLLRAQSHDSDNHGDVACTESPSSYNHYPPDNYTDHHQGGAYDAHNSYHQLSGIQRSGRLRRASDEPDRASYGSRHSSPRSSVQSPRAMFVASEDKENNGLMYPLTPDEYSPCSPLTTVDSLCICTKPDATQNCICSSEAIVSSPKSHHDLLRFSGASPKSDTSRIASPMSPKNDISRVPSQSPKYPRATASPRSPKDTTRAVTSQELVSQSERLSSQRSFFSPTGSTCSTRDSVVVYLNNPEFVALVISKFAFPSNESGSSDADDVREMNYHSMMPLTVTCDDVNLVCVKHADLPANKYEVAVKQLTLDIEHYLGEVIRTQATWGHRFIDVLDYDAQVLHVCASSCTVVCKVDVWVHARQELPTLPVRNSRKIPINLYKTVVTYEWIISTGCLNTLYVEDIQQVDERTWRLSRPREQERQREIHSLRKQALLPQSYYRNVHVMTNAAVLRGKSLPMLVDTQHYVAIIL